MAPDGDKIRVTARISKELDTKVHRYYTNLAPAIIEGLELLVSTKEGKQANSWHQPVTSDTGDLMTLIGDKDKQIEFLKGQLAIKDSQLERQAFSLQSLIQVNSALNMKLLPEVTPIHAEEVQPATEETEITTLDSMILNEEPEQPLNEELQLVDNQKTQKNVKKQHSVEVICAECGKTFTAERSTRKFCSAKCKTAYGRRSKK